MSMCKVCKTVHDLTSIVHPVDPKLIAALVWHKQHSKIRHALISEFSGNITGTNTVQVLANEISTFCFSNNIANYFEKRYALNINYSKN